MTTASLGARGEGCILERPGPILRHPERIRLGRDVKIGREVRLQVNVGQDKDLDPWIVLEDQVVIGAGCQLSASAGITIGAGTRLGEEVLVLDNAHRYEAPYTPVPRQPVDVGRPIRIGARVYVGRGTAILMGVHIGDDAVVLDRAVVRKNVPPGAWVAGIPARPVPRLMSRRPTKGMA